jgi:hypothetical protein
MRAGFLQTRYGLLTVMGAFLFGVLLMVDDESFTYMTLGCPPTSSRSSGPSVSGMPRPSTSAS